MRRISVFWKYFMSYLLVLLIPFVIVSIHFSRQQQELLRKNTRNYYTNMLRSAQGYADNILSGIENVKYSIEHSLWLQKLCFSGIVDREELDVSLLSDTVKSLSYLSAQQQCFSNVSISLYDSSDIYSSNGIFNAKTDYSSFYANEQIGQYFFRAAADSPFQIQVFRLPSSQTDYLLYISGITNVIGGSYSNRPKGDLNIALNGASLLRGCSGYLEEGVILQIDSSDGQGFSLHTEGLASERQYEILTQQSDVFPSIDYRLYVPEDIYTDAIREQQRTTILSLIAVAFLALLLCCFFSYYHFRPISRLRSALPRLEDEADRDELAHISRGIEAIHRKYADAKDALDASRPYVTHYLFFNLLYGPYDEDIGMELRRQQILFDKPNFCALAVLLPISSYCDIEADGLSAALITKAFADMCGYYMSCCGVKGYVYEVSADRFGIIVNFRTHQELEGFTDKLAQDCVYCFHGKKELLVCIGVGRTCQSLSRISVSYDEACRALEQNLFDHKNTVSYYEDIVFKGHNFYDYSAADESSLINAITKGDMERACTLMQSIVKRNLKNNSLDMYSAKCLHYQLLSTLIKAIRQLGLRVELYIDTGAIGRMRDFEEIQRFLETAVSRVCEAVLDEADQNAPDFEDTLIAYVKEHLYDSQLSLQMVADYFNVSMAYISQVFKRMLGVTYSEYVNKSRIARALELKQTTGQSLAQISAQVGYDSMSTFRRNFIKFTGVTPSAFEE